MVDNNGQLKIVDCEVYTKNELNTQQKILDNSQNGYAKGHKNANRILQWNDGRPGIEDICK